MKGRARAKRRDNVGAHEKTEWAGDDCIPDWISNSSVKALFKEQDPECNSSQVMSKPCNMPVESGVLANNVKVRFSKLAFHCTPYVFPTVIDIIGWPLLAAGGYMNSPPPVAVEQV